MFEIIEHEDYGLVIKTGGKKRRLKIYYSMRKKMPFVVFEGERRYINDNLEVVTL